jgi:flagella basal body P-ring formation protein FlgA
MMRALLAAVLVCLTSGGAQADLAQPLTGRDVAALVREALAAHGQEGAPILADQRRFFPCEVDLTVSPRREGRWDAVDVACPGNIPWSIVVRTSADVPPGFSFGGNETTGEPTTVVVVRHTIRRGEVITADKLELAEVPRSPAPGAFTEIEPLIGRRMVQTLSAGVPIRERHLQMEWSVRADDPIVIETNTGEMVIAMSGIALQDGQAGDFIRVRNLRSGRVVTGMVTDDKKIIVTPNMN